MKWSAYHKLVKLESIMYPKQIHFAMKTKIDLKYFGESLLSGTEIGGPRATAYRDRIKFDIVLLTGVANRNFSKIIFF